MEQCCFRHRGINIDCYLRLKVSWIRFRSGWDFVARYLTSRHSPSKPLPDATELLRRNVTWHAP